MEATADRLAGRFIVLDGPDGSGKSTQLRLLAEHLAGRGAAVLTTRDPGGTAIGEKVRRILLDASHGEMAVGCEVMLYMASRAQLFAEVIAPALREGRCVLCDRWVSATFAYQGAGGVSAEAVRLAYRAALGEVWPDLTMILDLPAEAGLRRLKGAPDRVEGKDPAYHRRVRELFLQWARGQADRCAVVDGAGEVEQVQARLQETLAKWPFAPRT